MRVLYVLLVVSLVLIQACSKEAWQRTGYATMQNMQEQQCEKELSVDCPDPVPYEDYQQQRAEP